MLTRCGQHHARQRNGKGQDLQPCHDFAKKRHANRGSTDGQHDGKNASLMGLYTF